MTEDLWSNVAELFFGKAAILLVRLWLRARRRPRLAEAVDCGDDA